MAWRSDDHGRSGPERIPQVLVVETVHTLDNPATKEEPIMQNDTRIGVDIAKAVFEVAFRTVLIG